MKIHMQHSSEPVGDWFLYEDYIVLRVYGFMEEPYKLPAFLTKIIFVLEFLRQRLYVESELFLKRKKVLKYQVQIYHRTICGIFHFFPSYHSRFVKKYEI